MPIPLSMFLVVYYKHLPGSDEDSSSDGSMEESEDCILILKDHCSDRWFRATVSPDTELQQHSSVYAHELGLDNLQELDMNMLTLSPSTFPCPLTQCPPVLVNHVFIKRAKLSCLVSNEAWQYQMALLREEIIMCEKLMHHPHPGIAKYYGVVVQDGRILGLAFKKYRRCLDEFDGTEPDCPSIENVCASIQAGIGHLHGLGVVHNDINPGNICIDEDGRAVIIDFNSARPTGERLGLRGGTTGFCRDTKISEEQNDLYGLRAIRAHLQFVFKGEVSHN